MSENLWIDLRLAMPELILVVGAMWLLMLGTFRGNRGMGLISWYAFALLVVAGAAAFAVPAGSHEAFGGLFLVDGYTLFLKILILIGSAAAIILSLSYLEPERMARFEYPVLIVLATLGMLMMVSANDLMSLFIGLELQSLALYILAAIKRNSSRATEAGLKYFVLGALSTGMLLYGCSLIYGFTGTTNFVVLAATLGGVPGGEVSIAIIVGMVFLITGLAFKISAVPFHMWTPDVYEGAPTPVTAFFAVAPKIAAFGLIVRVLLEPFGSMSDQWSQIIVFLAIASMFLGAFAAIAQSNIKRLMAYSSIGHVGFALIGLAAGSHEGVRGVLIYLVIYLVMNVGTFACILKMRHSDGMVEDISDLAGLAQTRPGMAAALAIFMFSLAGIPPLAGFFGKFYVLMAALHAGLNALAILGVLASVIGAYYYLRVIKIMYFDPPAAEFDRFPARPMNILLAVSAAFTLLFFLFPQPLVTGAARAAAALF